MTNKLTPDNSEAIRVDEADHFKIAQAVYNAVTGKTEKLSRVFGKEYFIKFDDFIQLHRKCKQVSTQWKVLQSNTNVTVHHLNDNKETFSSIERFQVYDKSRATPAESVSYVFNMLLELPEVERPQPYKITVRALSQVAMLERMEKEMPPPAIFRLFTAGNIVVEVEFVDYLVAKNMLSVVESWVSEIEVENRYGWVKYIQRYSHWIPPICHFVIVFLFGLSLYHATPSALKPSSNSAMLAQWLIISGTFLILAGLCARFLGRAVESGIDRVTAISCLQINNGDDRLYKKFRRKNVFRSIQAVIGIMLVVAQGILVGVIVDFLKNYLLSS